MAEAVALIITVYVVLFRIKNVYKHIC